MDHARNKLGVALIEHRYSRSAALYAAETRYDHTLDPISPRLFQRVIEFVGRRRLDGKGADTYIWTVKDLENLYAASCEIDYWRSDCIAHDANRQVQKQKKYLVSQLHRHQVRFFHSIGCCGSNFYNRKLPYPAPYMCCSMSRPCMTSPLFTALSQRYVTIGEHLPTMALLGFPIELKPVPMPRACVLMFRAEFGVYETKSMVLPVCVANVYLH